jgi:arylsulfatase A-like enzyme
MNRRKSFAVAISLLVIALAPAALAAGKAKHVLIVVMDGLRPDAVTEANMPTLFALAKSGTFFENHHPTYISSTEVNGTALATGMFPGRSGVVANREYRPDVELLEPVDTQSQWAAWKREQANPGAWIRASTLPEMVRGGGLTTAVAGTKGVALIWDRDYRNRMIDQPTVFDGKAIPSALLDKIIPDLGPMPPSTDTRYFPNVPQDSWTVRVLTEKLWADRVPALSILWLSEPDYSQHGSGPGSKTALAALKSSDDRLATALAALEQKKLRDQTDVFVVSDHGFSTVSRNVEVLKELQRHDFAAGGAFLEAPPPGSIMVVGLGGSTSFYVTGHDPAETARLVTHLQSTDWAGVIFTRDGLEGTFKLSDANMHTDDGPDVVVSMRWDDRQFRDRMKGALVIDGKSYLPGQGMHGSLSRFDMHNTLIAAGPDFKPGLRNKIPSGNADVTPTVLHILGVQAKDAPDGRVLAEALTDAPGPNAKAETTIMKAQRRVGEKTWNQYLKLTKYEGRTYYDEGNSGLPPQ